MTEETYKEGKEPSIHAEDEQIYVTAKSARKAAYEVVGIHAKPYHSELAIQREQVFNEIINTYLPLALPTNEEQKTLKLTRELHVFYKKEDGKSAVYDIWNLHKEIKPVAEPVEISLTHFLALCELDNREIEMKASEDRMADRLFEELMYMREKKCIEVVLPEILPWLEFKSFCYDTYFWKDILSENKKESDN